MSIFDKLFGKCETNVVKYGGSESESSPKKANTIEDLCTIGSSILEELKKNNVLLEDLKNKSDIHFRVARGGALYAEETKKEIIK